MDDTAEDDLAGDLRDRLQERDQTVAVAETVTGGRVGAALTATPGASAVLDRVLVPYDYDSLRDLLAVDREALDQYGAVSAEVTAQLARAIRDTADVTWGVANTGIAGPEGGTDDKPVGTAFVAVAYAAPWGSGDSETTVERYQFDGDRATVQSRLRRQTLEDVLNRVREQ
ncbi:CinA family protein [Halapricum salinum]|uniref:CinA family protein n=1 Tax=Halapricum salinum TaxID=1457250 RepID=A0A4D6HEN6_9EURY|nr:CinA family protein [Halapricum salinum]QCC52423.1 CinA family protein [Halapricum salinum]